MMMKSEAAAALMAVDGPHELYLSHPRFRPLQMEIDVEGMRVAQQFSAELEPAWANISVNTVPEGATVLVDGEPAGTTPAMIARVLGWPDDRYPPWR